MNGINGDIHPKHSSLPILIFKLNFAKSKWSWASNFAIGKAMRVWGDFGYNSSAFLYSLNVCIVDVAFLCCFISLYISLSGFCVSDFKLSGRTLDECTFIPRIHFPNFYFISLESHCISTHISIGALCVCIWRCARADLLLSSVRSAMLLSCIWRFRTFFSAATFDLSVRVYVHAFRPTPRLYCFSIQKHRGDGYWIQQQQQ